MRPGYFRGTVAVQDDSSRALRGYCRGTVEVGVLQGYCRGTVEVGVLHGYCRGAGGRPTDLCVELLDQLGHFIEPLRLRR